MSTRKQQNTLQLTTIRKFAVRCRRCHFSICFPPLARGRSITLNLSNMCSRQGLHSINLSNIGFFIVSQSISSNSYFFWQKLITKQSLETVLVAENSTDPYFQLRSQLRSPGRAPLAINLDFTMYEIEYRIQSFSSALFNCGFHIVNFPFLSSNIPSGPTYGVYTSQLIRYARC